MIVRYEPQSSIDIKHNSLHDRGMSERKWTKSESISYLEFGQVTARRRPILEGRELSS